ncbi:hypothetical protein FRACYDRAFT_235104 [Fragilariopsis cylindrus CCMP1102]|uniref:Uncharacterized protein n=1 Tax=Fragilariopsis cylindrus CCMP1102 TaxID=635003 RepID=A0A1E7FTJ3_9STRA|nr:hypothetical protein FRACYDRAFT_235104 [Fragilariopsis cylindrus CCMP1102]|eukprot:OEU21478.1 hypothetical protein FRACYDRAFT_235104 [Fragilariopsis cylindrus CCMP1102]
MDDVNIDNDNNNNDDVEEQQLQHEEAATDQEQERIVTTSRHLKINSVLKRKETFPLRTRNKVDVLVQEFLNKLEDDIHDMLCDNGEYDDEYRGLDCNRDTEEEVEAIVLLFPDVLTRKNQIREYQDVDAYDYDEDEEDPFDVREFYPIQSLAVKCVGFYKDFVSNVKAVSFIPLLARLAIKLDLFEEEERGGLLCQGGGNKIVYNHYNVLENLMHSDLTYRSDDACKREHHEAVDDKYLQVLIQLRKIGLLKKEDIQKYNLILKLCGEYGHFSEKRFRFLIEWDPNALLISPNFNGSRPTIQRFQTVFESGIRYFPKKKGINLLFGAGHNLHFHKSGAGNRYYPFERACTGIGYEQVMKVVEDTLIRYLDTPINVADALLSAAVDENVHLDCVYFLLRRQPDVLVKLLSSSSSASSPTTSTLVDATAAGTNDNDNHSINNVNSGDLIIRKRKRG